VENLVCNLQHRRQQMGGHTATREDHGGCSEGARIMKASTDNRGRLGSSTDFRKGTAFALLSLTTFALLLLLRRPEWANPWLIASLFTFAVWRLGRPSKAH
jgi:hypothetical protein